MEDAAFNPLSGLCTVSSSWASYSGFRKACQFSRRAQTSWSGVADSRAGARAEGGGNFMLCAEIIGPFRTAVGTQVGRVWLPGHRVSPLRDRQMASK